MLPQQQTIQFSDYSELYDMIIPQDNLLRRINDLIDFSFIQKELVDKYCHDNGRMAESTVVMFKYLLLKTIYDISDVDIVERSRYDMSFKYFLCMTPENIDLINPSSLCKFRKLSSGRTVRWIRSISSYGWTASCSRYAITAR